MADLDPVRDMRRSLLDRTHRLRQTAGAPAVPPRVGSSLVAAGSQAADQNAVAGVQRLVQALRGQLPTLVLRPLEAQGGRDLLRAPPHVQALLDESPQHPIAGEPPQPVPAAPVPGEPVREGRPVHPGRVGVAPQLAAHRRRAAPGQSCSRADRRPPVVLVGDDCPLVLGQEPRRGHHDRFGDHRRILPDVTLGSGTLRPNRPRVPVCRLTPTIRHASVLLTPCAISRTNSTRCAASGSTPGRPAPAITTSRPDVCCDGRWNPPSRKGPALEPCHSRATAGRSSLDSADLDGRP